ncbi:MAG: sigma-70 family RNA polymerase sigma factor [Lachnospiraceae bacterium]|nr:sigma-70 family RNA polymerase sigma factor [Lachnospiraceae bacterium]
MKQIVYEKLVSYIVENQNRFYRVAYSYTRRQEDALDAVQTTVCKALESYEAIKNADAIKTWFYRILINECLTILKKRKKTVLLGDYSQQEEGYYDKDVGQKEDINDELSRLEPDIQGIIRLRFFEELTLKEISCITGMNLNTVKTKLYRGLELLKENIQEADL